MKGALLSAPCILAKKEKTLEASRKQSKLQEMKITGTAAVPETHREELLLVARPRLPRLPQNWLPRGASPSTQAPLASRSQGVSPQAEETSRAGGRDPLFTVQKRTTQTQDPQQDRETTCSSLRGTSVQT